MLHLMFIAKSVETLSLVHSKPLNPSSGIKAGIDHLSPLNEDENPAICSDIKELKKEEMEEKEKLEMLEALIIEFNRIEEERYKACQSYGIHRWEIKDLLSKKIERTAIKKER